MKYLDRTLNPNNLVYTRL